MEEQSILNLVAQAASATLVSGLAAAETTTSASLSSTEQGGPYIPPMPDPFKKHFNLCPESTQLDFSQAGNWVKQMVFWFTIPMLTANITLIFVMIGYICTRATKFCKANWLTKLQLFFLITATIQSTVLLALFTYTTKSYMFGEPREKLPDLLKSMNRVGKFLFSNCASGARLCYGIITFFVGMSALLAGYRQIQLAQTIHDIVQSGDLQTEEMKKRFRQFFIGLVLVQLVYFCVWVVFASIPNDNHLIQKLMASADVLNFALTLSGLLLYMYTIRMLRRAISKCVSFQFETFGTYLIGFIFSFTAFTQVLYLVSYEFIANVMVYLTLLHFLSYFIVNTCIFIMLLRTGTGLILLPHQLNDGQIQYEGYTKDNKHLFTFRIDGFGQNATRMHMTRSQSDSLTESDLSADDIASREQVSNFTGSIYENADRLTEYDATERLLSLQFQLGKMPRAGTITSSGSAGPSGFRNSSLAQQYHASFMGGESVIGAQPGLTESKLIASSSPDVVHSRKFKNRFSNNMSMDFAGVGGIKLGKAMTRLHSVRENDLEVSHCTDGVPRSPTLNPNLVKSSIAEQSRGSSTKPQGAGASSGPQLTMTYGTSSQRFKSLGSSSLARPEDLSNMADQERDGQSEASVDSAHAFHNGEQGPQPLIDKAIAQEKVLWINPSTHQSTHMEGTSPLHETMEETRQSFSVPLDGLVHEHRLNDSRHRM